MAKYRKRGALANIATEELQAELASLRVSVSRIVFEEVALGISQPGYLAFGAVECAMIRVELARRAIPNHATHKGA